MEDFKSDICVFLNYFQDHQSGICPSLKDTSCTNQAVPRFQNQIPTYQTLRSQAFQKDLLIAPTNNLFRINFWQEYDYYYASYVNDMKGMEINNKQFSNIN